MADTAAEPKRWVILKFFQHAVERTEAEIAELKYQGLHVRDASGPGDVHVPDAAPQPAAKAPAAAPAPASPPAADKPKD